MLPASKLEERPATRNRLLAALAWREHARLASHLEEVSLAYKDVLHKPGEPVEWVYFPEDAIVSLLSFGERDAAVEVGMVGGEGMVGAPILLGNRQSPYQAVVLRGGRALRSRSESVRRNFTRSRELRDVLLPYAHALLTQSAQSAACHRFHTPPERLCRWLLMVHDRAGSDEFRATQEFISDMLGTRRATVTEAAHSLQQRGLIDYRRGRVLVRDRAALERLVCRCYFIIKQEFDQLAGA
jgi:CRP-like cAMP-binding protein